MDLFTHARRGQIEREAPLAARMRPRTLDELVGQEEIVGPGRLLRRAIEADRLFSSIILWGPPGTGKTSLAMIIARRTQAHFEAPMTGEKIKTCRAFLTYVSIDEDGKSCEVPPLIVETDEERKRMELAKQRREVRLRDLRLRPLEW